MINKWIMEIQHCCYTRGNSLDYGFFSCPGNMSSRTQNLIRKKVLSVIDEMDCRLATPKWMLLKCGNTIIWGVCCWNRLLAQKKYCDYSGTPVSGFFSVVITDTNLSAVRLPFDICYFKQLYALEVEASWEQQESHSNKTAGLLPGAYHCIRASSNAFRELLNTDMFRCKSLGRQNKEEVVAAALTLENVSLLIDNDNIEQATNRGGSFMNCLSVEVPVGEYVVKQECPKCKRYVSAFTDGGVCPDCQKQELKTMREEKEKDMDRKLQNDLEIANRQIQELKSIIASDKKALKRKAVIINWLLFVCIALLMILSFAYRDTFSIKWFEKAEVGVSK